jgi:hypothetical protein
MEMGWIMPYLAALPELMELYALHLEFLYTLAH